MSSPAGTERAERALRWLFAIQLVSMGAMDMSGPFWPLHLRGLGGLSGSALAQASALAYAGPLLMAMCFTPLWGRLADRLGHKPMVLRALFALAATQAWIAFAGSVASVLAARLVQGALAGFIAAAQAYGVQLCERSARGRLIARLQVATAIGSVAGPFAGGLLFERMGFQVVNLLAAALCLACLLAASVALPGIQRTAPSARDDTAQQAPRPWSITEFGLLSLLLGIVIVQAARMMPQAFFGLYAEQALGLSASLTGLSYGATALGLCIGAPLWGRRFDAADRHRALREAACAAWACAVLTLAQRPGLAWDVLLAVRFGWGLALGALLPMFYALLSHAAPLHRQGAILGWGNAAAKAGALAGGALGGLALGALPLTQLMWPVAAAYAVAACGLHWLRRRARRMDENIQPYPI